MVQVVGADTCPCVPVRRYGLIMANVPTAVAWLVFFGRFQNSPKFLENFFVAILVDLPVSQFEKRGHDRNKRWFSYLTAYFFDRSELHGMSLANSLNA